MRGNKLPYYLMPRFRDFDFVQPLTQSKPLHHPGQEIRRGFTSFGANFFFRQAAPFRKRGSAN